MRKKRYWGYRIGTSHIDYFYEEVNNGFLRQGWGYNEGQDLNKLTYNEGASRNLSIKQKVKKGDILLVPRLPEWDLVAIVEAKEDWDETYEFDLDELIGDFGHKFPAKLIKSFARNHELVSGNIRSSLRNPLRFWNMDYNGEDIENLIKADMDLGFGVQCENRFERFSKKSFNDQINESKFKEKLINDLNRKFEGSEWEDVLTLGFQKLFPNYIVEKVGNKNEQEHGSDIIIKIPGIFEEQYIIAIQIKDYYGSINDYEKAIAQINLADEYWKEKENHKLIEKWLFVTNVEENSIDITKQNEIKELLNSSNVKILYSTEFKNLIFKMAQSISGINIE